jgi:Xaa-Pro aminopeptidase
VRSYISEKGYGEYFTHGLGHGVGLQIHELPVASKRGVEKLMPSMVLTIEPGVYIADKGGVRIEDMVVITPSGCDILTQSSKELFEID